MNISDLCSIDALWECLRKRLVEAEYQRIYATKEDFESDVWSSVVSLAADIGLDVGSACLTSHAKRSGRSSAAWSSFCDQELGPDVNVLGAKNRLDIVFIHPRYGSIGIEVKCLGANGHTSKLTQGIGQATLAIANRDRTLLIIHCGTVSNIERQRLRKVCEKVFDGMKTAVIVVPSDFPLRTEWRWQEGAIDKNKEHIEIRYGDASSGSYEEWTPVALISKPVQQVFSVSWLKGSSSAGNMMIEEVCRELDFYLIEKHEPEPWKYAIYHCSTAANMYSKVHWSYFPDGQQGDKQSSRVVKLA